MTGGRRRMAGVAVEVGAQRVDPPCSLIAIGSLGDFRYEIGAARSGCHLAQRLHKNPPRLSLKCVLSAHPARSGAQPARIARSYLQLQSGIPNLLTGRGLE